MVDTMVGWYYGWAKQVLYAYPYIASLFREIN